MLSRKNLLIAMAVIEVIAGLALLAVPSLASSILLGVPLENPGLIVARVAGAALLSLGVACSLARTDDQSAATAGLIAAMLTYNVAAAAVLVYARVGVGYVSILLWPAAALHALLALWCIAALRGSRV